MNTNELISVIVPVYNVEGYLEKCIQSITTQTYTNLEILVVDDGSTDTSPALCDELAETDTRIQVIHKKNGGLSSARNSGIDAASGEYYVFVDSDDYIHPQMIEQLYSRLKADNSDLAICGIEPVDEDGNYKYAGFDFVLSDDVWDETAFWNNFYGRNTVFCVVAWNKLYPKALFSTIRFANGKTHEDEFMLHNIVSQCKKISCVNQKLYYYLQRSDSIMNQPCKKNRLDLVEAYALRGKYFKDSGQQYLAEKSLSCCPPAFLDIKSRLDMTLQENRQAYKNSKIIFKKHFFYIASGNASLKFRLNMLSFVISERLYLILHTLFKKNG